MEPLPTTPITITRLPVWLTVDETYKLVMQHAKEYFKISWCWMVGAPILFFVYNLIAGPYETQIMAVVQHQIEQLKHGVFVHVDPVANAKLQLQLAIIGFPSRLIFILLGASIAVSWHRLILRSEKLTAPQYFRHDAFVQNYFIFGVFLSVATMLPQMLGNFITITTGSGLFAPFIILIPMILLYLYAVRFTMYLPAIALGMAEVTLQDVRARTRSNFWRLAFGYFLSSLISLVPLGAIYYVGFKYASPVALNAISAPVFIIVGLPFHLTFMSLAFRHFYADKLA